MLVFCCQATSSPESYSVTLRGYPRMCIGVLRPLIVRMTIGWPQAHPFAEQVMYLSLLRCELRYETFRMALTGRSRPTRIATEAFP